MPGNLSSGSVRGFFALVDQKGFTILRNPRVANAPPKSLQYNVELFKKLVSPENQRSTNIATCKNDCVANNASPSSSSALMTTYHRPEFHVVPVPCRLSSIIKRLRICHVFLTIHGPRVFMVPKGRFSAQRKSSANPRSCGVRSWRIYVRMVHGPGGMGQPPHRLFSAGCPPKSCPRKRTAKHITSTKQQAYPNVPAKKKGGS